MAEKLMTRGRRFVDGFLSNGGMNAISDIIKECVNLPSVKDAGEKGLKTKIVFNNQSIHTLTHA